MTTLAILAVALWLAVIGAVAAWVWTDDPRWIFTAGALFVVTAWLGSIEDSDD